MPIKPVPTKLRALRGNPSNKPFNKYEPQPSTKVPPPPSFLDKIAKKEYRRLVKVLAPLGVITELDATALAVYAHAFSIWAQSVKEIQINGLMATSSKNGNWYQNPYVGMSHTAMDRMMKISAEFGLTPSSRTRIVAKPESDKPGNAYDEWKKSVKGSGSK